MGAFEYGPISIFKHLNYSIVRDGTLVGTIDCAWLGEYATVTLGGASYTFARDDSASNGGFYLEGNGARIAEAQKGTPRLFTAQVGAQTYTLKAASIFDTAFVLIGNGVPPVIAGLVPAISIPVARQLPSRSG
jgi:hypothetical protein